MQSVRFLINAFIPKSVCELFGDTFGVRAPTGTVFSGDQREFSDGQNAGDTLRILSLSMRASTEA